jgi:hypothetical protein
VTSDGLSANTHAAEAIYTIKMRLVNFLNAQTRGTMCTNCLDFNDQPSMKLSLPETNRLTTML